MSPLLKRLGISLAAPAVVLALVPLLLLRFTPAAKIGWLASPPLGAALSALGMLLIAAGLALLAASMRLFLEKDRGTNMPWEPVEVLVVEGVYRHARNPMHSGIFAILFGEGLLFRSAAILVYAAAFVALHLFYIPLSEERDLEERFGEPYSRYKRNVPRWIPRLTPWQSRPQ